MQRCNLQHATSNLQQNPITSTKKLANCKKWGGVRAGLGTTLSADNKNVNKLNTYLRILLWMMNYLAYELAAVSAVLIARSTLLKKKRRKTFC